MNKYMISVDWLQVYCRYTELSALLNRGAFSCSDMECVMIDADIQTAMFKRVVNVMHKNLDIATLQFSPRSAKLDERMVILKISNRVLYCGKFIRILYELMGALKLTYKGITRLDLCYDCTRYKDNRSPSRFINDFIVKRGISQGDIRKKGSEEFTCHGKKAQGSHAKINYIRFGSPQSKIAAYIYDKSLELEESKDKPWIRSAWAECGIDDSKEHVFRSEISIKAEGADVLNMSTGELFRLSPDMLESQQSIEAVFHMYAKKYFDFRLDTGQKRKKDFIKIHLFENVITSDVKPIQINKSADTGRIEKICYNVLERLSCTYTDLSEYRRTAIEGTQMFLKELQGIKTAKAQSEAYLGYLNSMRTYMFSDAHFNEYMSTLQDQNEIQKIIQAEMRDYHPEG